MSPEIADLTGAVLMDFPVSGKTCGSSGPGLEVLAALEIKWTVRAQLPTAPEAVAEVCVRAARAVQLLWELRPPALGDVVPPGNAALSRQGAGAVCLCSAHSVVVLPRNWLRCR